MRSRVIGFVMFMFTLTLIVVTSSQPTLAANPNVGYSDFAFGSATDPGAGDDATASKPQSKLWYNDGSWWSVMFDASSADQKYHIYQLDATTNKWSAPGAAVDDRPLSRADALWDGSKLYIVSTLSNLNVSGTTATTNQGRLYRYSYSSATKQYSLDTGFPVVIMNGSTETLTIDKDSTGTLWIVFTKGNKVIVRHSAGNDATWTDATITDPTNATTVFSDDIASLVAFKDNTGSKIGVVWSKHPQTVAQTAIYFTYHRDGDPDTTWSTIEALYMNLSSDPLCAADDHINLKSLQADPSGSIFAALKTSFGDPGCGTGASNDPLIRLVVRKPNDTWAVTTFGTVAYDHTRPVVLLNTSNRKVYMFATARSGSGTIYMKSTSMDNPDFSNQPGLGTPFISSSSNTHLNNATTTKQTVSNTTGMVVLASDMNNLVYMHGWVPTVAATIPASNATGVSTGSTVTATFSEGMNAGSITSGTFTLTPAGGSPVAATVTYNISSRTVTLTPAAALAPNTSYTARFLSGITDAGASLLEPQSWSFSTGAASTTPDTTPPTVTGSAPAANATGISTSTNVAATFSEPVTGVSAGTFTLAGPSGPVAAVVALNGNTATLTPTSPLQPGALYTANLLAGIADTAGNPLAPLSWSFTTASTPSTRIKDITFEGGCLGGASCPTGASTLLGTPTLETVPPIQGSYAATINNATAQLREDFTATGDLYTSFYLRLNAAPAASARIALISNSGTSVGGLYLTTSRTLQLRNGSTVIGSSSPVLSLNTLYRVGLHQKSAGGANGVVEAFLAATGAQFSAPFASSATQTFTGSANRLTLGATNSAAVNITLDTIQLDTAAFAASNTTPTPTFTPTPTPSATPTTPTLTPTLTPTDGPPTLTPTATMSATLTPTFTPSPTLTPTSMPPTLTPTSTPSPTLTPTATSIPTPLAPTGLTATAGTGQVSLSWAISSGATGYNVKRATTSGGPYTTIGSASSASFGDTTAATGTTYYYIVTATNSSDESGPSNQASATLIAPATPPPTGSPIKAITFESGCVSGATCADGADSVSGLVTRITTGALKGSASARIAPSATTAYLQEDFTAVDSLYMSFYVQINARPTSDLRIALISNAGTTLGELLLRSNGTLRLRNAGVIVGADSAALTNGTIYRIGIVQKKGTGGNAVLQAFLATGDSAFSSTPFAQLTTGTWTTQANRVRLGATVAGTVDITVDDVRLDAAVMP